ELIPHAHLDLLQTVEHVQFGQGDTADPRRQHRLPYEDRVEPPTATFTPRNCAEFVTTLSKEVPHIAEILCGKRSFPDARGVGLGDAEHVADGGGSEPGTRRRLTSHGVGGGHERIGAVIVVEQSALRPLEEDAGAAAAL